MRSTRSALVSVMVVTVFGCGPEAVLPDDSATVTADLAGDNMGGVNLSGANMVGPNLGGTNLSGSNLSGANLGGVNLGGANLGGVNLSAANLSAANLSGANLSGANLSGANLSGANLSASNLSGSNLSASNLSGANLSGSNLSASNQAFASAVTGANIHGLASMAGALLPSGEDLFHVASRLSPSTDTSCIVLGIGSPAFARLVNQNVTNFFNARLVQLPWNLSITNTSGVVTTYNTWEVLVWGNSTYASFIVVSPTGTTYEGMRGFVKAIFRWNAKPTQAIEIGQLGGGQPLVQYTGMMGAAELFATGTLPASTFIAGLVTLTCATTNNISVQVDFASYVLTTSGMRVLGNPSPSATQYDEGTWVIFGTSSSPFFIKPDNNSYVTKLQLDYSTSGKRPKRCAGAQQLAQTGAKFGATAYTVEAGKCDTNVAVNYPSTIFQSQGTAWSATPGSNGAGGPTVWTKMQITPSGNVVQLVPVVAGTHTYINEVPDL